MIYLLALVSTLSSAIAEPVPPSPSIAQKYLEKLSVEMEGRAEDLNSAAEGSGLGVAAPALDPEDISHRQILDELMSSLFLQRGDSWFTQTVRDANPVPYEFRNLSLSGPTSLVVTAADKMNGIDRRISFGFSVRSHRKFDKTTGWQAWVKGKPLLLTGIIMNRVDGLWVVASSPKDSFSL